jgi:hypothetical protein
MEIYNRADRRRMRRGADRIAAVLAASALQPDGRARAVTNTNARRVLTDGFAAVLRNNCRPITMRITPLQAASLPGYCRTPPGAQWWAAFGLDVDGRGTWVTRWALIEGLPPDEARDLVEVRLLADLAREANVSGLPVEVRT